MAVPDAAVAAAARVAEWGIVSLGLQGVGVFAAVALGAWAARRGMLDEPARHRRLLVRVAVAGLVTAVLGGLPFALSAHAGYRGPAELLLRRLTYGRSGSASSPTRAPRVR